MGRVSRGQCSRDRTFLFGNFEEGRLNTAGVITVTPTNAAAINARLAAVGYQAPLLPVGSAATSLYPTTLHTDMFFLRGDHRFQAERSVQCAVQPVQAEQHECSGRGWIE